MRIVISRYRFNNDHLVFTALTVKQTYLFMLIFMFIDMASYSEDGWTMQKCNAIDTFELYICQVLGDCFMDKEVSSFISWVSINNQ